MVKFYIEGDQFQENLTLDDSLELLSEEIVEALYTKDDVAWNRRAFGVGAPGSGAQAGKGVKP